MLGETQPCLLASERLQLSLTKVCLTLLDPKILLVKVNAKYLLWLLSIGKTPLVQGFSTWPDSSFNFLFANFSQVRMLTDEFLLPPLSFHALLTTSVNVLLTPEHSGRPTMQSLGRLLLPGLHVMARERISEVHLILASLITLIYLAK